MTKETKAHLALLGANLFYGGGYTVSKMVMPRLIEPLGFTVIRVSIVSVLFWVTIAGGKEYRTKIEPKDFIRLIAGGLFGVALNQMLFYIGLNQTLPIHASLIMLSTPLLILVMSLFLLKEKLRWDRGLGLLLGVGGALLLINPFGRLSEEGASAIGDLFVLLNAAFYAIYLVIIKPMMLKYRPLIVIRWVFLFGFVFVLPFGWKDFSEIDWSQFRMPDYYAVAFIVICCTFFTYLWNVYALKVLSPSVAGAYIYLQPVFAAIISVLFYGESITIYKVVSALLIFSGVYLVNFGWKRKKVLVSEIQE